MSHPSLIRASSSSLSESTGYVTRTVTQQREFDERVELVGSGLDELTKCMNHLEELEIIDRGYISMFSTPNEGFGPSFLWYVSHAISSF